MKYRQKTAPRAAGRLFAKLRSQTGETISETMIAVLIAALSLVMLAGGVAAASRVIAQSRDKLETYYTTNEKIIRMTDTASSEPLKVESKNLTLGNLSVPVYWYENDTFRTPVITYKYHPPQNG